MSAAKQRAEAVEAIVLHVPVGASSIFVMLGIFRILAVHLLLGTSFINKFMRSISLTDKNIISLNSPLVPIFIVYDTNINKTEEQKDETFINVMARQKFEAKLARIAPTVARKILLQITASVSANAKSCMKIHDFEKFKLGYPCRTARVVMDVYFKRLSCIVVVDQSKFIKELTKHKRITTTIPTTFEGLAITNDEYPSYLASSTSFINV